MFIAPFTPEACRTLAGHARKGRKLVVALTTSGETPLPSTPRRRPAPADVERLSRGQGAKQRGTGSRAVPHRLNADERRIYEIAVGRGFATVDSNLGYRRERKGSPLFNTWRMWNDARGHPSIFVVKRGQRRPTDELWLDLSTLRGDLHGLAPSPPELVKALNDILNECGAIEHDGQPPDRNRQEDVDDNHSRDDLSLAGDATLLENWAGGMGDEPSRVNTDVELIPTWRIQEVWLKYRFEDRSRAKEAGKTVAEFFNITCDQPITLKPVAKKSRQIRFNTPDILPDDVTEEDERWLSSK